MYPTSNLEDWCGKFFSQSQLGGEILTVAHDGQDEMLLIVNRVEPGTAPLFVHHFKMLFNTDVVHHHHGINYYECKFNENEISSMENRVLKKVSVDANKNTITISEYKIEEDYFHQCPPDDESKLLRISQFSFCNINAIVKVKVTTRDSTYSEKKFKKFSGKSSVIYWSKQMKFLLPINMKSADNVFEKFNSERCGVVDDELMKVCQKYEDYEAQNDPTKVCKRIYDNILKRTFIEIDSREQEKRVYEEALSSELDEFRKWLEIDGKKNFEDDSSVDLEDVEDLLFESNIREEDVEKSAFDIMRRRLGLEIEEEEIDIEDVITLCSSGEYNTP